MSKTALPPDYFVRASASLGGGLPGGTSASSGTGVAGGRSDRRFPDFYIGAHAAVAGMTLLTRDARRYRTYFPKLRIIAP